MPYQTTKTRFRFPSDGSLRYIPDLEHVSNQVRWSWETVKVESGQEFTAETVGGDVTFETTEERTITFPYRVKSMVVAKEVNAVATWDNPADYNALRRYAKPLARVETVAMGSGGSRRSMGWGTGYVIQSIDTSPMTGNALWRITLDLEANERAEWLAYALYRKEAEAAATAIVEKSVDTLWSAIDTLGLV